MMKMGNEIKVVGGKTVKKGPTILSQGMPPEGDPTPLKILDRTSRTEQPPATVVAHEEIIADDEDRVRSQPKGKGEPEIRLRHSPTGQDFEKIKRGDEF